MSPLESDPGIQWVWFRSLERSWRSLGIIPTDPAVDIGALPQLLAAIARQHDNGPVRLVDARGTRPDEVKTVIATLQSDQESEHLLVVLDPLEANPAAVHLARAASATLLVVQLGRSRHAAIRNLVNAVGRQRCVGAVVLT